MLLLLYLFIWIVSIYYVRYKCLVGQISDKVAVFVIFGSESFVLKKSASLDKQAKQCKG